MVIATTSTANKHPLRPVDAHLLVEHRRPEHDAHEPARRP
jgi:hypothetical protein